MSFLLAIIPRQEIQNDIRMLPRREFKCSDIYIKETKTTEEGDPSPDEGSISPLVTKRRKKKEVDLPAGYQERVVTRKTTNKGYARPPDRAFVAPDGTILRSVRGLNSYVERSRRWEADLERLELAEKQAAGLKARLEQAEKKVVVEDSLPS